MSNFGTTLDSGIRKFGKDLKEHAKVAAIPDVMDPPGDITRPASISGTVDAGGTFDVPEVGKPVTVPVELFQLPALDVAKAFLRAAQAAPNLKVAGDPKRGSRNAARYIRAYIQHLAQALERI